MFESFVLFAQQPAAGGAAGGGAGSGNFLAGLLPFVPVLIFFYFFLIRPQQKQERIRRSMLEALKKNDRVLTQAGIIGTVTSIDAAGDKVVVRVDDDKGIKLTFAKSAIVRVITAADKEPEVAKPVAAGSQAS